MNDVILMIEFSKFTLFNFYFIAFEKKKDSCLHIVECANIAEIVWQKTFGDILDPLYISLVINPQWPLDKLFYLTN